MYEPLGPIRCRYVRIYPLSWSEKVALRTELYGYESGKRKKMVFLYQLGAKEL